ncbi:MAG: MBOAT family O-acyltransferase [Sedimenticola sp.]
MHYLSFEYLLLMMTTFSLYWLAPAVSRHKLLVLLTAGVIGYLSPESLGILILFSAVTLFIARQTVVENRHIWVATILMISALGWFKWDTAGLSVEQIVSDALIPLGMSYYTFRCLHLIYERHRGRFADAKPNEIIGFLFFLPTLLVGPIHRFGAYQRDQYKVRLERSMLTAGAERILYGYVKIGFLSNYLVSGQLGSYIDNLPPEQAQLKAYLWIAQGGLNLYFQFSGFADIAIGFSRLLGFRVMENFNWPFLQRNLSEYWRCWHISLTSWCREYINNTVVSRTRSPALGAIATLIAIGLWHELSLRYIVWGLYHGLGLVVWQRFQVIKTYLPKIKSESVRHALTVLSILFTVHYVWFGFALVRLPHLSEALDKWKMAIFGL